MFWMKRYKESWLKSQILGRRTQVLTGRFKTLPLPCEHRQLDEYAPEVCFMAQGGLGEDQNSVWIGWRLGLYFLQKQVQPPLPAQVLSELFQSAEQVRH